MPDNHPTFQYKWPSKVLRYKISCSFQRLLIAKHESQIDWSGHRIESGEALDRYVREVMLPGLKHCITPDHHQSHYCKSIHLERMLANPAPHINEARQIQQRDGDEAARQFLLGHINRQKKVLFEQWWRYILEENPLYQQHPAFQYLVLRPLFEGSTARDTRAPLPLDAEAVAHLFELMQTGDFAPGIKLLQLLSEIMAFGAPATADGPRRSYGTGCRWEVVRKGSTNAANRVAAMSRGSGWCVASASMADLYLDKSDFHLLLERGRAVVALRMCKQLVVEIQGKGNEDPGPWWPRILLYCDARRLCIHYRSAEADRIRQKIRAELSAAQGTAKSLALLLKDQPAKVHLLDLAQVPDDDAMRRVVQEAWLACVRADPLCSGLLPEWMAADPQVVQMTQEAWLTLVSADPLSFRQVPRALIRKPELQASLKAGWMRLLKHTPGAWDECPPFLQQEEEVRLSHKTGWIHQLKRNAYLWDACPKFLQVDGDVMLARKAGWIHQLTHDVRSWDSCPTLLQQEEEVILARKAGWIMRMKHDASAWTACPEHLQHDNDVIQACRMSSLVEWLKNQPKAYHALPESIKTDPFFMDAVATAWRHAVVGQSRHWHWYRRWGLLPRFVRVNPQIRRMHKDSWIRLLRRRPEIWGRAPRFVLEDPEVQNLLRKKWIRLLTQRPQDMMQMPEFLRASFHDEEIFGAWRQGWIELLKHDAPRWHQCPGNLRQDAEVIQACRMGWIERLTDRPIEWQQCPENLRQDAEVIQACRKGWIERLADRPIEWQHCPENLRQDAEVLQACKTGWIEQLKRHPESWTNCPELFQQDEVVIQALRWGWLEQLKQNVSHWGSCPQWLRQEPDVMQSIQTGWIEHLSKNVLAWNSCPDFLQQEEKVIQTLQAGWIARLTRDVTQWSECPEVVRERLLQDPLLASALKTWWIQKLKKDVTRWDQGPEFLQEDGDCLEVLKTGWLYFIRFHPGQWDRCPRILQNDREILAELRFGWLDQLRHEVFRWQECPDFLQADLLKSPDFLEDFKDRWKSWLEKDVRHWARCPEFLQQDPEVIQSLKAGWLRFLKHHVLRWHQRPEFLHQDSEWTQALIIGWTMLLQHDVTHWKDCPDALKKLADVQKARREGEIRWARAQSPGRKSLCIQRLLTQKILTLKDLPEDLRPARLQGVELTPIDRQDVPETPLPAYAASCFTALAKDRGATLEVVKSWRYSPRLELARCSQALQALKDHPWNFAGLSAEQQSHALIRETAAEGWSALLSQHPQLQPAVPEMLRSHPQLKAALAEPVLKRVKNHPGISDAALNQLGLPKEDTHAWKQIAALRLKHWKKQLQLDGGVWQQVPESLRQHAKILQTMRERMGPQIRQNPALWNDLPSCYREDPCLQRVHRFATHS